ncbi:ectoine/hydroxyectoine ABC transporter permease subunit EhuD [Brevibacillus humidisoli]|uniref:ectoine/hydroxyectoine ABC transporter permease subunit EhuD n=1 Tax=Brevibacillus humidisoli TaxID=2895522 RepID=UPI001E2A2CEB|nr:ectoine/hydroxyectoine ABC transporter permease subunit EhuD [Brevibacillus humidisoli]UFJ40261.1 ectoine/hydroxyectoine ABC transporter permease subunit EhuD [Brevibacillus humidisoli]
MWDWNYAFSILPKLLEAALVTIAATFVGFVISVVFGLLLTLARRSSNRLLSLPAVGFVEFVRSTPLLVQVIFLYYAMPAWTGISLSAFTTGSIALGLHYSTYLSEVYRSGIDNIPKGQWEAATALNFTRAQTWLRVILPQSIPPIIPVMGNYLLVMFKDTPILSAITLVELLQTAKIIGSQTFEYVEPFTLVGLIFLLLSYPSSLLVRRLEARLQR